MKQYLLLFSLVFIANNLNAQVVAVCQNIDVYVDASGIFVIAATDLDGGSTGPIVSYTASQTTFTCADIGSGGGGSPLVLTGVIDGPLTGGLPKAVELYAREDIADLSLFGIGSANNGGGTDGVEFPFPVAAVTAGTYIYVATEVPEFTNWFGFAPTYTDAFATNINGDDAIELFQGASVVDVFGEISVDGTGEPWEYLDGWTYRDDFTGPDGSTFVLGNWSFSGINALDGETTNGAAAVPFPLATYLPPTAGVPVQLYVSDGGTGLDSCTAIVTVYDTISPTVVCASPTIMLDASGTATITAADLDGGTTDNCTIDSIWSTPISVTCDDIGVGTAWLYAVDIYGNSDSCMSTYTVDGSAVFALTITQTGGVLISDDVSVSYQWIDCATNTDIVGETSQSYLPTIDGNYAVIVSVGTCIDTSECITISGIGFEEEKPMSLDIYPNPARDKININLSNAGSDSGLSILDITGKVVFKISKIKSKEIIDLSGFREGIYLIQVSTPQGIITRKITVLN